MLVMLSFANRSLCILLPVVVFSLGTVKAAPFQRIPFTGIHVTGEDVSTEQPDEKMLEVTIREGAKGMPGAAIRSGKDETLDLSAFNRIEAAIRNTGSTSIPVSLRVDNAGHWRKSPWNTESIRLAPGQSGTLVVFFGYANGRKPSFVLDPAEITQLLFFAPGAEQERRFVVESIAAAGAPGDTPANWQDQSHIPAETGLLLGKRAPMISGSQLASFGHATVQTTEGRESLQIQFNAPEQSVLFRPLSGKWNLRNANHLEFEILNTGDAPLQTQIQLDSPSGPSSVTTSDPIPPGKRASITVPFARDHSWVAPAIGDPSADPANRWSSKSASGITFLSGGGSKPQSFQVSKIQTVAPALSSSGKDSLKPPVPGDWISTFAEEFDRQVLNESLWNVYTNNHWDKRCGFSKDNVLMENGVARLRFEHRTAKHNDEPDGEDKAYTTGFLDTFGKWSQKYGYFEARMKLPRAPGLWPAFWMMPDRGPGTAPRWKREQTTNGGMEFDIMEHLSSWGPYRYNIAFHWDGYGKNHQHTGTSEIYLQTDEEGFFTAGLLWLPGKAVYYCNGEEVGRWESDRISSVPSVLMFTHVSGGWDNEPLQNDQLPADFVIDYVRCWQLREFR